jgi:hypothetical protein
LATFRPPSPAVLAAHARRAAVADQTKARFEWYINEVVAKVGMTMEARVRIATEILRSKVVENISKPVTKGTGPRGGQVVKRRSKPGQFPRADTTLLMHTIFSGTRQHISGIWEGYVATPLDYGAILEIAMDRSYLVRTMKQMQPVLTKVLTGPII